uniref:Phosphoglycolate phosphatase n=1 Tax=Timema monikensis TaxID=170555 RepID=A0A7R9EKL7_9NEOP|nr:unnamed protein product [Timema monikensis]
MPSSTHYLFQTVTGQTNREIINFVAAYRESEKSFGQYDPQYIRPGLEPRSAGLWQTRPLICMSCLLLSPGCFSALLEKFTGRSPIVIGKPEVCMVHLIEKIHHLNPSRTLMIGDSLDHDILLGSRCGFQTLLVLSGQNALEDATDEKNMPKYFLNKLGDLLPLLSSQ